MALFPVRVKIIRPAVCEEPTNSGREIISSLLLFMGGKSILTTLRKSCAV